MTRRGTLAYYLAAWVIGCFVMTLLAWAWNVQGASTPQFSALLMFYFVALMYGAVDILLFAFLLRRLMRLWGTHRVWVWMLAGAGLGTVLLWWLLWTGDALTGYSPLTGRGPLAYFLLVFWTAPNALRLAGTWQAPIGGAATAAVLCLVDQAFNRPAEASEPARSVSPPQP
jgi:hypothetical protein